MTLIEVLIAMVVIVIASIATLTYFGPTRGYIGRSGNRRAALERARQRMEELQQTSISALPTPCATAPCPQQWLKCVLAANGSCTWPISGAWPNETVSVGTMPTAQPMETTVTWVDDVDTVPVGQQDLPDEMVIDVRVGFNGFDPTNAATDTDFNRVLLRTVRAP